MTAITIRDGKIVLRDGKVGTEQACCCDECSGPCDSAGDCGTGCDCVNGQCVGLCVETPNEIWTDCTEDCPNLDNCTTQCIPAGTGPPNIPPCGVWVKFADASSDCIPCGDFNPFP